MDCNTAAHFQPMDVSSLGEALAGHQDHGGAPGRGRASAGAGQPAADVLAAAQSLQAAAAPAASSDSESSSDSSDSESSSPHARAELERGAASAGGPAASPVDPNAIHARATSPVGASSVSSWASSEDEADTAPGRGGKARGPAAAAAPDQASVADGDVSDDEAEEADGPSSALFGGPRTKNELPLEEQEAPVLEVERLPEDAPMRPAGRVLSLLGSVLVVEGYSTAPPLDEGTLLCMPDRGVVGKIEEVFGQVSRPHYVMRLPPTQPRPEGLAPGADVMFSAAACSVVDPDGIRDKGCDASNMHDEEIPAHEMEYSDDEAEATAKRKAKTRRRGRGEAEARGAADRGPQAGGHEHGRRGQAPPTWSPPRPFQRPQHAALAPMPPAALAFAQPRPAGPASGAAAGPPVPAGVPMAGGVAGYGTALLPRPGGYPSAAPLPPQAGPPRPPGWGPAPVLGGGVGGGYGTGLLPRPPGAMGQSAPSQWAPAWQQQPQHQVRGYAVRGPPPQYAVPPGRGVPQAAFGAGGGDPYGFGAPPPPPPPGPQQ